MPKGSIDHCSDCKVRLKNTKHERTKATLCPDCRGNAHTNYKTKELTNNLIIRNSNMTKEELEMTDNAFADKEFSKWAEKKDAMEVGRVIIQSTHNASYGVSPLGDIMKPSDTNQYRKKNEPKKEGVNYD